MKNLKLSQETKEILEGAFYFIIAFTVSLLIASTLFNK